MSVRRETRTRKDGTVREFWKVDVKFKRLDGTVVRVKRTPRRQTRAAAEKLEREIIAALEDGTWSDKAEPPAEVPLFADYAAEFLRNYAVTQNKPSEISSKRRILHNHLVPVFGAKRLDEIGVRDVDAYKARKQKEGLAKKSINNHLTVLGRALRVAVEWGLIVAAPPMRFMRADKPHIDFLEFEEAERLIAASDCRQVRSMITLALNTGMRVGELLALQWSDVDLTHGKIVVRRNLDDEGNVVTPKSGKGRELPLNRAALDALKAVRHLRSAVVFSTESGAMMTRIMAYRRLMSVFRRAGLAVGDVPKRTGWHMLRHTFASHLAMRGVPLKAIQELLGHATIDMTMRYAHLSPAVTRAAVDVLDSGWGPLGAPSVGGA
jgi:integrase